MRSITNILHEMSIYINKVHFWFLVCIYIHERKPRTVKSNISTSHKMLVLAPNIVSLAITLFKSIIMLCGTNNIPRSILGYSSHYDDFVAHSKLTSFFFFSFLLSSVKTLFNDLHICML